MLCTHARQKRTIMQNDVSRHPPRHPSFSTPLATSSTHPLKTSPTARARATTCHLRTKNYSSHLDHTHPHCVSPIKSHHTSHVPPYHLNSILLCPRIQPRGSPARIITYRTIPSHHNTTYTYIRTLRHYNPYHYRYPFHISSPAPCAEHKKTDWPAALWAIVDQNQSSSLAEMPDGMV